MSILHRVAFHYLFSIVYLAGIYSSPRAASWSHRFGCHRILLAMLLFGLLVMLLPSLWAVLIGLIIFTFAFFAAHSIASSWVSVQSLQYRAVGALYLFCYYLGSSLLSSSSGLIWEAAGWLGLAYFICSILLLGYF